MKMPVWELKGEMPNDWSKTVIIALFQKGSHTLCKNYRGISLLSVPSKVYGRVLEEYDRKQKGW